MYVHAFTPAPSGRATRMCVLFEALARCVRTRFVASCTVVAWCCLAVGCYRGANYVRVTWTIEPAPPVVGVVTLVDLSLQHEDGTPVIGAKLHMQAHPSTGTRAPVNSDVTERQNGLYAARLVLPSAGDWVFVVSGELTDGSRIMRDFQVPGVRIAFESATRH